MPMAQAVGAVAVVVGDDEQARVGLDRVGQHLRRFGGAGQRVRRQQRLQRIVDLAAVLHAARGIQPGQQRMDALLFEQRGAARRDGAVEDEGHWFSRG